MKLENALLADIILNNRAVDEKKLRELQEKADSESADFYNFLINEEVLTREKLGRLVAGHFQVAYLTNLEELEVSDDIKQLIPPLVMKREYVMPFMRDEKGVHLAMNNPGDDLFLNNFKKRIDEDVIVYFADQKSFEAVFNRNKNDGSQFDALLNELIAKEAAVSRAEDLPIINVVDEMMSYGIQSKASDIHIEPYDQKTVIRFRIDGILHDIAEIPSKFHELIVARIKILARLRTDEHQAAQDGKLRFKYKNGTKIDVRVSILPVVYGEKVVMRILAERSRRFDLENLGFSPGDLEKIENSISRPWGMILATGPTGSGKTTTLYAILKKLNTREVNVSTIEDPVEYDLEGVNQIQVNPKTNLTFARGLRAIVRQDPDIIMVGEIRDEETAKIAINSAMTGHLVLSTLHTNDAATAIPRLLDMEVEPFLAASTVNLVIAQRLVRKLCDDCKAESAIPKETLELIKKHLSEELIYKYNLDDPSLMIYEARQCEVCKTGYSGRIGIYEVMGMNDDIRKLIMSRSNASTIRQAAINAGMTPMMDEGIKKVLAGQTTINELLRVAKE